MLDVQHGQAFQHQLAGHPQCTAQVPALSLQTLYRTSYGVLVGQTGVQAHEIGAVASPDALHKATVRSPRRQVMGRGGIGGGPVRCHVLQAGGPHRQHPMLDSGV